MGYWVVYCPPSREMVMEFLSYKNRFGKTCVLENDLFQSFLAMQSGLSLDGIDIEMVEGWRGAEAQNKDASTGHSNATFGHSAHNYGVAFDCVPIVNNKCDWNTRATWLAIGKIGEAIGLQWGLDWTSCGIPDDTNPDANHSWPADAPHFNIKGWKSMNLTLYTEQPPLTAST